MAGMGQKTRRHRGQHGENPAPVVVHGGAAGCHPRNPVVAEMMRNRSGAVLVSPWSWVRSAERMVLGISLAAKWD